MSRRLVAEGIYRAVLADEVPDMVIAARAYSGRIGDTDRTVDALTLVLERLEPGVELRTELARVREDKKALERRANTLCMLLDRITRICIENGAPEHLTDVLERVVLGHE